jgi:hypothetical protein
MEQWNPTKLTVSAGTVPVSNYADGVMFSAVYVSDQNGVSEGADGKSRHVKIPSKTAEFTIRCKAGSPSNGVLQGFVLADIPIPIIATDGTSKAGVAESLSCKIKKVPAWEKAAEESVVEWVWNALDADIIHSGARD